MVGDPAVQPAGETNRTYRAKGGLMKMRSLSVVFCLAAAFAIALGGCRKKPKADEAETPKGKDQVSISELGGEALKRASDAADKTLDAAEAVKEKVLDIAQQFQADQTSTIPEVSARKEWRLARGKKSIRSPSLTRREVKRRTNDGLHDTEKNGPQGVDLKASREDLDPAAQAAQVYYDASRRRGRLVAAGT